VREERGQRRLMRVVADANVLVSAALGRSPEAPSVMALMRHLMDGSNWLPRRSCWRSGRRARPAAPATLSVTDEATQLR